MSFHLILFFGFISKHLVIRSLNDSGKYAGNKNFPYNMFFSIAFSISFVDSNGKNGVFPVNNSKAIHPNAHISTLKSCSFSKINSGAA